MCGGGLHPLPPVPPSQGDTSICPFPRFSNLFLNAPQEPMSQLFHGAAEGYALLSDLYSAHACISILFRVSVHYAHNDISLQLRTREREGL